MKMTEQIQNVQFINFPVYIDENNEKMYGLFDMAVAEYIAENIHKQARSAVVVDFDALDVESLKEEIKQNLQIESKKTKEEERVLEEQLLESLFSSP
ncbi:hypothetical protein ACOJUR_15495 [Alicyclobacillus tolerans]|uniref:Phosphosulfolactate phosphohydrolase-like enzyme n=1 Tax=Alicyclobacillus tolerans TaxID=90970 RepID=A0ABT9LYV3_9BACL|nr:hypothetical protein [Alicyclobacillus tengchongensis]MDP9729321.1 phosphosulfolactate phosphohydrolase-like enzyme [Alicyclobacillus tengchongensis]